MREIVLFCPADYSRELTGHVILTCAVKTPDKLPHETPAADPTICYGRDGISRVVPHCKHIQERDHLSSNSGYCFLA